MTRCLIVTADDFGRSRPINEAVETAHRQGILTAASLMVTGEAARDAVHRARSLPRLGVGLHLALVDARPALPPARIPDLVEADGRLSRRLVRLGVAIALRPHVQAQLREEIRAQFELYRETGLAFDHVDSHHHYHLHPTVLDLLLPIAREYGVTAVRVPWEPPWAAWRAQGDGLARRLAAALFHITRLRRMRRRVRQAGFTANDSMFGMGDSGAMDAPRLLAYLDHLPPGLTELYCHPATRPWADAHPMPSSYRCVDEYHALVDPRVLARVRDLGLGLTTFSRGAACAGPS